MRKVAIIQARMGSTRLPGKVLADLAGEPVLTRVINRVNRAESLDEVIVATTTMPSDEPIVELCQSHEISCFRGSEDDVLDRYYHAALQHSAELVVRITSDCPLIEPCIIDRVVEEYLKGDGALHYVSNTLPHRTYPRGLDTEAISFNTLACAWQEDDNPGWREHVTPFIYRNPDRFQIQSIVHNIDLSHHHWVVDTLEDLKFIRQIYNYFMRDDFDWTEVLELLERHPEWLEINRHIRQ